MLLFVIPSLRTLKKHCEVDIESLTDEYRKIHTIHSKMQYLESGMYHLLQQIFSRIRTLHKNMICFLKKLLKPKFE
jgi:hypothetical protein